ncbi:MAG: hypothetical protein U0169_10880 [Polyangiaceae bacterium]
MTTLGTPLARFSRSLVVRIGVLGGLVAGTWLSGCSESGSGSTAGESAADRTNGARPEGEDDTPSNVGALTDCSGGPCIVRTCTTDAECGPGSRCDAVRTGEITTRACVANAPVATSVDGGEPAAPDAGAPADGNLVDAPSRNETGPVGPAGIVDDSGSTVSVDGASQHADVDGNSDASIADADAGSADAGEDGAHPPVLPTCATTDVRCRPAAGTDYYACARGSRRSLDTSASPPRLRPETPVVLAKPAAFDLDVYVAGRPIDTTAHDVRCELDGVPIACESSIALPALTTFVEHPLSVVVTKRATGKACAFAIPIVTAPLPEDTDELPTWEGNYMVGSAKPWLMNQENEHVWVGPHLSLGMSGRNYCIHRASPAACTIVMGEGSRLNIWGSNVNTGTRERADIVLGPDAIAVIRGSNFAPGLTLVPSAVLYEAGSNILPKDVARAGDFDVSTCPFSRTGGCPADLTRL